MVKRTITKSEGEVLCTAGQTRLKKKKENGAASDFQSFFHFSLEWFADKCIKSRKNWKKNSRSVSNKNIPTGIYLLKVSSRNTRTKSEICSKVTIKTPELYG